MNNEFVNFYEFLGLKEDVTEEDLDFYYQEIIKFLNPESHPDKTYSHEEILAVMKQMDQVNQAYRVLKDPKLRKAYDKRLWDMRHPKITTEEPSKETIVEESQVEEKQDTISIPEERIEDTILSGQTPQKETFAQNIKQTYQEVRQEEKKYPLKKRHERMSTVYDEAYADKVTSLPKEILFYTGKGTAHVFLEVFYQLSKLLIDENETGTKYVLRNRRLIALALEVSVIASCGWLSPKKDHMETTQEPVNIEMPISDVTKEDTRLVLTRNYLIKDGDTLSNIAYNANTSIDKLKRINGYDSDRIYTDSRMVVPYTIEQEDLTYYTESINLEDDSLEEIATNYETDLETLYQLNQEAITKIGDQYIAISDTILVPKFSSKQEVQEMKAMKNVIYD